MTKFSARKELAWMWGRASWGQRVGFLTSMVVGGVGLYWVLPVAFHTFVLPWVNLLR